MTWREPLVRQPEAADPSSDSFCALNGDWNVDCWRYDWVLDFDIHGFSIDWTVEKHGKETTLTLKASTAKTKPIPVPNPISFQPCGVSKTVVMNCVKD